MKRIRKTEFKESDAARLNDLVGQHGLTFKRAGRLYIFDDFTACGLDQALGYAEGYDRAMEAAKKIRADVTVSPFPVQLLSSQSTKR